MTHEPPPVPPKQDERLTFTFVAEGVEQAVALAASTARDKAITVVGGADVIRQLLRAGLVDEFRIDVMPVLLGSGMRLFEGADGPEARLEKLGVEEVGERTSLRFLVRR